MFFSKNIQFTFIQARFDLWSIDNNWVTKPARFRDALILFWSVFSKGLYTIPPYFQKPYGVLNFHAVVGPLVDCCSLRSLFYLCLQMELWRSFPCWWGGKYFSIVLRSLHEVWLLAKSFFFLFCTQDTGCTFLRTCSSTVSIFLFCVPRN